MNQSRLFWQYLILLVLSTLGLSLWLPRHYGIPFPHELGPQTSFRPYIKKDNLDALTKLQPKVVLLGDSFLREGVDQDQLSKDMGLQTYKIGLPGTGSAVWYLVLKNTIVDAPVPPRYVVILFRSTILTVPSFRTSGNYFAILDDYAGAREPLVTQLAFINSMSPGEKLAEQYFPLYSARWKIREGLDAAIRYPVPAALLNCSTQCTTDALNSTFGFQAMDAVALQQAVYDAGVLYSPENLNFEKHIDQSFLPPIIHVAQENNIQLIFVRVKTMAYPNAASEPPGSREYLAALKQYLAAQPGVQFVDMAYDERIPGTDFKDLVHLNDQGRSVFTQILAEELLPLIK